MSKYLSNLDFNPKNIGNLKELISETPFLRENFLNYVTLRKVQNGDPVGLIGEMDAVGLAGAGCDPEFGSVGIANTQKRWALGDWQIPIKICYEDLVGTVAEYALKTGTNVGDLTDTDFMLQVFEPALSEAIEKMIWRIGWFGDTAAANVSDGGSITDGVDVNLFKATDGFWKKLFAIGTANPSQVTAVTTQTKAAMLVSGVATGLFDNMIMDADSRLTASSDSVIYVTKAMADALTYDIKNTHHVIMPWEVVFDGVKVAEYNGVKIAAISIWDRIINAFEGGDKPYRAVFTNPKNLQVGTNADGLVSDLDMWFEKKERRTYIYATGKIGTMVLEDSLVHLAY